MRISEGNLIQQCYCDYLETLLERIFSEVATETVCKRVHEHILFRNLFLHRMSVDGGFHARVLSVILQQPDDSQVLMDLLAVLGQTDVGALSVEEWLKREYASAAAEKNGTRMIVVAALLRSYVSGTNQVAEIIASVGDFHPLSWWQLETRRIMVAEIANPGMYFDVDIRPFWHEYPLDRYVAVSAGVPALSSQEICECVVCIAGTWFSSLTRAEMITWLNMPQPTLSEWDALCAPLLKCKTPDAALSTANWLYASGNDNPAMNLYANITLAFPGTPAEISSFESMGTILRKLGDFDNAFEAYKNAFIASRCAGGYKKASGLKNLCDVGEDLGEDMSDYYMRIAGIASMLPMSEKLRLYLDLATSCRRRHAYEEEYRHIEHVLDAENGVEDLMFAAMSRLLEMNSFLSADGKLDVFSLAAKDEEAESTTAVVRGISSYFGFDPCCALEWYGRAGSLDISSLEFVAAMAAGTHAEKYAMTSAQRTVVLAARGAPIMDIVHELNSAITDAWKDNGDISVVIEQIIPHLSSNNLDIILAEMTTRSTRDDERAIVCSAASQALLSVGRVNEARSMLRIALRSNSGREMRANLFADLGWLEYEIGQYQEAAAAYDAALKINSLFPAAWAGRARVLACMGEYDEAFAASCYAVTQNPSSVLYQHLREALGVVSSSPVDPRIDLMFILPESGYLQAAAAEYTVRKTGACPPMIWDVSKIEDVIPMRF
ncbi:MAG: tetratricopeptide repeat protein [Methanocalculaceae archaeon]|jgi:tetratricopeptide (TPR) repeat protein|nr:tetratricopeptide repeat protein [Methanocalculaceae archaeon]